MRGVNMGLVNLPSPPFRPGTDINQVKSFFFFSGGGMGDYICNMVAMRWIAETQPQVIGRIVTEQYYIPLFANMMAAYEDWEVIDNPTGKKEFIKGKDNLYIKDARVMPNACGMNMVDLAFAMFANKNPIPPDSYYPQIDFDLLPPIKQKLPKPYVVMTPGASTPVRTMPAEMFNGIKAHVESKGYHVVMLGSRMKQAEKRKINFHNQYDYTDATNLLDQTSILQAAQIINEAEFIVGLDNGLLHLAACTNANIVFGYNVASPEHRRPKREADKGLLVELHPDPQTLPCVFCQSNVNLVQHDFSRCLYKDLACLNGWPVESWCEAIDGMIEGINEHRNKAR
jgi:ADP-heptose:LPS heptosyltransferase